MHARQPALRESRVVGRQPSVEGGLQEIADLLADDAVVAVARHEDEHRDEAVELVDAHQRPDARPLAQRQDRLGMLAQGRNGDLEEFVARIGFQYVDQRLAGMVAGLKPDLAITASALERRYGIFITERV